MTNEEFDKWIAALESGEYKQHRYDLYGWPDDSQGEPNTFCCLGVLARVLDYDVRAIDAPNKPGSTLGYYPALPIPEHIQIICAKWNDNDRLTFTQIADRAKETRDQFVSD